MLNLYSVFHLNLSYSSIEEEQRAEVIDKCYRPLLELAEELDVIINIEASAFTLESIKEIDPAWISRLCTLIQKGKCEFIGSGYMQLIGPLVPAGVNKHNQEIGLSVYEKLLQVKPQIALINEQAYSAGLVRHYLDAGYSAIVMEWNNAFRYHPEWPKELQYFPQKARGVSGENIPLIWNNAIAFQKFQRYAHGDLELTGYIDYLKQQHSDKPRAFTLYTNDAEIFDYRPGRYHTEATLHPEGEWSRIRKLFEAIKSDDMFDLVSLTSVLNLSDEQMSGNVIKLESPEQPVPVKKQNKYCISRWAVTGISDTLINTGCYGVYKDIHDLETAGRLAEQDRERLWRELCYLWGSDFRTHTTENKFNKYLERLENVKKEIRLLRDNNDYSQGGLPESDNPSNSANSSGSSSETLTDVIDGFKIKTERIYSHRKNHLLCVETESMKVQLNCKRGLAIDEAIFKPVCDQPLIGTLHHGFYEDISLGADFYTGHFIAEMHGRPKVTDLNPVKPQIQDRPECVRVSGTVDTELGAVTKTISIYYLLPRISIQYDFQWSELPFASIRAGMVTLMPDHFNKDKLFYRTHNGGYQPETFLVSGHEVLHDRSVSHLISLGQCLGATDSWIEIGDERFLIRISSPKETLYSVPLVNYREVDSTFFFRIFHSLAEIDETRKSSTPIDFPLNFTVDITAERTDKES